MFWEQDLIRIHKISKIPGLGHQDHDDRIETLLSLPLKFEFKPNKTSISSGTVEVL
jgi:hypothetical protein